MANYSYRIYSGASNTAPNFTTVKGAWDHAVANDPTSSGTNGRVAASSTLYFKIDGWLTSQGVLDLYGIDTTTNSNASIVIEPYANPFNSAVRALGRTTSYDGIDCGSSQTLSIGTNANRQAKVTLRNLVLTSALSGYGTIMFYGPTSGADRLKVENCFISNTHATGAQMMVLFGGDVVNCVFYQPNSSTSSMIYQAAMTGVANKIDHCTFFGNGSPRLVNNAGDPMPILRNCYAAGFTAFVNSGTYAATCVGDATDLASGWSSPTTPIYSVAPTTTNFIAVSGSEDLRVQSGSVLKTTGAAKLTGEVDTDIFGQTRASTATIGAYEYVSGASSKGFAAILSQLVSQ